MSDQIPASEDPPITVRLAEAVRDGYLTENEVISIKFYTGMFVSMIVTAHPSTINSLACAAYMVYEKNGADVIDTAYHWGNHFWEQEYPGIPYPFRKL